MNKYLIEILKIQSSVILPGLGALMVPSQKSGKIVFNPHLKFNDGSLARFIAEKENIDEQESQNKVAKFVREIEAELGKGNSYDMFEFGSFYKNKDNEVDFDMHGSAAIPTQPEEKKEPVVDAKKTTKPATLTPADILSKDKKESKKESKKDAAPKAEKAEPEKVEETDPSADKQAKNKFVPPVVDALKEDVKAAEEKLEDLKDSLTEKVDKLVDKVAEVKADQTEKAAPPKTETKEAIVPPVIAEKTTEEDKQSKNKFIPPIIEKKNEDQVEDKKPEEKKDPEKVVAAAAMAAGTAIKAGMDSAKETTAEKAPTETKTTPAATAPKAPKKEVVKTEKKKRSKLPWLILLLLLIGLGAAGFFYKDKIMAYFDKETPAATDSTANEAGSDQATHDANQETVDADLTDETETDEMAGTDEMTEQDENMTEEPNEEIVEEPVEEAPPVITESNPGSYHLIGNSFGEEANATRYAETMQGKGYPAKVLGRFDGLYLVSIKSFDSREAAESGRGSVSADASSAWVFKYKN